MAMIRRLGTTAEKFELEMTIHAVHINLDVPCALKVVVKRGKHKSETQELRYSMKSGVVFFEQEVKLPVTLYKRGSSYQEKPIAFRLVRVVGDHYIKDGKGSMDLNGVAVTGVPVFREDVPLKKSLDKDAVVCVSLNLIKLNDEASPSIRSQKHAATAPPVRIPEANRNGLRIDPVHVPVDMEADSPKDYQTPLTAGPASTYFSPEARVPKWSPVSEQVPTVDSLYGSPEVTHSNQGEREAEEDFSPVSAPLKSILSRPGSRKVPPVLKKSVSLKFQEPDEDPDSPLLKLVKVVESQEEDRYEKKPHTPSSSSEEEAPSPAVEHRDEEELSDGEKETREAQERKRSFRLDLSKAQPAVPQSFTNGEDTSSDEEPVLVKPAGPVTLMKAAVPNKQSKEKAMAIEEKRTGMPPTSERSSSCSGCILQ